MQNNTAKTSQNLPAQALYALPVSIACRLATTRANDENWDIWTDARIIRLASLYDARKKASANH